MLKAAKVAVHILGLLSAEARASRLSFADVVKRLAELAEGDSAFISKKVCLCECVWREMRGGSVGEGEMGW